MKVNFDDAPDRLRAGYVAARPSRASAFPVHALNAYQLRLDPGIRLLQFLVVIWSERRSR
jgi:hypothetical protein